MPVTKYVRFEHEDGVCYGLWDDDVVWDGGVVRELAGGLFDAPRLTGRVFPASQVRLLVPCELGPAIVTGLAYGGLGLQTRVNGEVRQAANTRELVFSPDAILSFCSRYVTLLPGDVIFTGTPGQTQAVSPGDLVEVEIEGPGVLRNRVGCP